MHMYITLRPRSLALRHARGWPTSSKRGSEAPAATPRSLGLGIRVQGLGIRDYEGLAFRDYQGLGFRVHQGFWVSV